MAEDYCRSVLKVSLAQICQNLGWNATQGTPLELLTDVLERYLLEVAKVTHRYSEQFGRTEPNLDDLGLAFGHLGIQLGELEEYVNHVDPLPFAHDVVAFPVPKESNLQFARPDSGELLQREEHIPEYMPPMFPDEVEPPHSPPPHTESGPDTLAPPPTTPSAISPSDTPIDVSAVSPGLGEKRLLTSPPSGGPPSKRTRLTTLPEEASHSQYEMKSMAMNFVGEVMPTGGYIGKLPDAKTPPQGFPKRFSRAIIKGSSSVLSVARDILAELKSKKDSNEGSQKQEKDKHASSTLLMSKKIGDKKVASKHSEKRDIIKIIRNKGKKFASPGPRSRSKSPARAKSPKGGRIKKGTQKVFNEGSAGLFSENILLERLKAPSSVDKSGTNSPTVKVKEDLLFKDSPRSSPLDLSFKPKPHKPSESVEKKRRLDAIESSIDNVLRQSAKNIKEEELSDMITDDSFVGSESETVMEEVVKQNVKSKDAKPNSIDDTINAVIAASDNPTTEVPPEPVSVKVEAVETDIVAAQVPPEPPVPPVPPSPVVVVPPSPVVVVPPVLASPQTSPRKKGRPPKKGKNKGSKKPSTPHVAPPPVVPVPVVESPVEPKSPKDEKFAVFEFPESPPRQHRSQPPATPPVVAPHPVTPEEVVPPEEEKEPPVVPDIPIKQEVEDSVPDVIQEKSHGKDKDKHKSKEHKKEKKEKKKDKEKKKKNKDKDRDKERSKHKDKSGKSPGAFPTGLTKLKIRLGSSPFSSTVTYSSKTQSPSGSPSQRPEIPKLVIKPMPPLSSSQDKESDSPKSSRSSKKDRSKKDTGSIMVKKELIVTEKLAPSPPVARTSSPAPVAKTPPPGRKTQSPAVIIRRDPSPLAVPKRATAVKGVVGYTEDEGPPVLKMEVMEEPPVLTPQPSPRRYVPTAPPPRDPTPPKRPSPVPVPKRLPSPSTVRATSPPPSEFTRSKSSSPVKTPSPSRSPSPARTQTPSPSRTQTPSPSHICTPSPSRTRTPTPVRTPSPSRTRTPSPVALISSPIHHPSPVPTPTPTKPATPSPTPTPRHSPSPVPTPRHSPSPVPTPRHSPSPNPVLMKDGPVIPPMPPPSIGPPPPPSSSATKAGLQRTVTSETIGSFIDASSGEKVWICPACKVQDDGSPMIGCDICDDWYHWACIGIHKSPPEEESWYCSKCLAPTRKPSKRGRGSGRGRGRGRGRKKSLKD